MDRAGRLPIIVRKRTNDKLNDLTRNRFLVPQNMTFFQFLCVLRRKLELDSAHAIFVFTSNNRLISTTSLVLDVHAREAETDGILYLTYASENAFG
tara:strand:+ start:527 stop:814 length:288 start_codon:yes stop_codon:yes gene_type:complete